MERFLKSLKIIRPTPSFGGGPESLITYPPIVSASSAIPEDHRALLGGIDDSLLRLSVGGLEDVEDIIGGDLDRALSAV